jgi:hypothetical protein
VKSAQGADIENVFWEPVVKNILGPRCINTGKRRETLPFFMIGIKTPGNAGGVIA